MAILGRVVLVGLLVGAVALMAGCVSSGATAPVSEPAFFPPPPDTPRLQFLLAIGSDADLPGATSSFAATLLGEEERRELMRPRGIDVYGGVIYISDSSQHTVIKIDLAAGSFEHINDQGSGKLASPSGLALAEDGTLYVADVKRHEIVVFAPGDQHFLYTMGDPETSHPTDVAVAGDKLYVTDVLDHEIEVYDRISKKLINNLGGPGEEPGRFRYPTFLDLGPNGDLYVCDALNSRVQQLRPDGTPVASYGEAGDWHGDLPRPKGVAVDSRGRVHVLDAAFENAQIFLPDGRPATAYGGYGNFVGHMYLPFGIHLDTSLMPLFRDRVDPRLKPLYLVLVTNQAGPEKLNIYVFGDPKPGAAWTHAGGEAGPGKSAGGGSETGQ